MATAHASDPPPACAIVRGDVTDAPAIEALSALAFDPGFREAWSARQIAQALAAPGSFLLVARTPVIGGFALCRTAADTCELLLCAVAPGLRRSGIATALMRHALAEARARGLATMFLEVRESNLPARQLYERTGFRAVGVRPGYYRSVTGQSVAAITLSQALQDRS
jgi:ribosomal-protein-alanine N-acetyltransferase